MLRNFYRECIVLYWAVRGCWLAMLGRWHFFRDAPSWVVFSLDASREYYKPGDDPEVESTMQKVFACVALEADLRRRAIRKELEEIQAFLDKNR